MRNFESYDALADYINLDAQQADINPVRLVNVETMGMWVRVKSYLTGISQELIKLSDLCENNDIAPNINRLKSKLYSLQESTLVVPLSEYLRINRPIALKTLLDVLHMNYTNNDGGKLRLYILLYRMKDLISSLLLDPRKRNAVAAVVESSESDYSLTIIQKDLLVTSNGNVINGFKKYFTYWEQNPDKPIILKTSIAINYTDIVFSDNVEVIVTAYDLLRYFGLPSVFQNNLGTNSQWQQLVVDFNDKKSFGIVAGSIMHVSEYSDELFERWNTIDDYKRWILWLWARIKTTNAYLRSIFERTTTVVDFDRHMYVEIANYIDTNQYVSLYKQRKELLRKMRVIPCAQWFFFKDGMNAESKLKCLTDNTEEERNEILKLACEIPMWSSYLQIVKEIYPILWAYLQPFKIGNSDITAYFDAYKKCKVINCANDELISLMNEFAADGCKLIWKLKSRNALVDHYYGDDAIVLFVDALGVEYLNVINSCFSKDDYDIRYECGYCNLPSTTEYNNDFYENKRHLASFYELDNWKHSACSYPKSVVRELDLVQGLKTIVDKALKVHGYVIIAADHGTSRMAILAKGKKHDASDKAKIYKYGRYCVDETANYSDIVGCIQYDDFWIFANYDKFSQKGAPICETHGGATLEEMIVPVICISHKIQNDMKISLLTPVVKLPVSKEVVLRFTCSLPLNDVVVHVDDKELPCILNNGEYVFTHLIDSAIGQYTAKVIFGGHIIGELKYKVTRPVERKDKFDI